MLQSLQPVRHLVIGGGVVGLAIAARLSREASTLLLERHSFLGSEISSRNSEVVHSGIYYPPTSLKAAHCRKGQRALYKICKKYQIPHQITGKWILACSHPELLELEKIRTNAYASGVALDFLSQAEIHSEPNVMAVAGLNSPQTGIVSSHELMAFLEHRIQQNSGDVALSTELVDCQVLPDSKGYQIIARDTQSNETHAFHADSVINAAGLSSSSIAKMIMKEKYPSEYQLAYVKGHYIGYKGSYKQFTSQPRLLYPAPEPGLVGLGIHLTVNLAGQVRFGPDTLEVEDLDYGFDKQKEDALIAKFHKATQRYLPHLDISKMFPDFTGIRPKIAPNDGRFKDFIIQEESEKGFSGLVNLIGIESPGLTSSLSLANQVAFSLGYPNREWE